MAEFIEGEWKSFVFKMAKPEHYLEILQHLRDNFHVDEPLGKILKLGENDDDMKELDAMTLKVLDLGVSFIAIDKVSGDIAGVRLTEIEYKNTKDKDTEEDKDARPKLKILFGFLKKCSDDEGNVFKNFPEIDKFGNFVMASVHPKYRGQGLATEMYRRSLQFFNSQGVLVAKSVFTSPYTRKAALNLGFVELKSIRFLDYKDPQGVPYLPSANDCDLGSSMAIRII